VAAVSARPRVEVRAPRPSEGKAIAQLWRALWDAHEGWGSYAGAKDEATYAEVASRIDREAQTRAGQPALGRHLHLVAAYDGEPLGQVEGWLDRFGDAPSTPWTCEVRSLVVSERAQTCGLGRALLTGLGRAATQLSRAPTLLVAEVLAPNPAITFYERIGYAPVSWVTRVDDLAAARAAYIEARSVEYTPRAARSSDAYALAALDSVLADRRRASGDVRFDPPRALEATYIGALAARLDGAWPFGQMPLEVVVADASGAVRASASLYVSSLDPPFLPFRRGVLTRLSVDPAADPAPIVRAMLPFAAQVATSWGAQVLEVSDLGPPGTPLHDATLAAGARRWSTVVAKLHTPQRVA
jgi:GNAT superfamily N-acetyltransferase